MCSIEELQKQVLEYNPQARIALIERGYTLAKKAHEGQKRESGEDYFTHPLEVAKILIGLRADSATICAALLHDTVEEGKLKIDFVRREFGDEVAELVEGVTKIDKFNFATREDYTAENIRKMLIATAKDVRVILIKLADRLHNMRTLKHFKPEKQRRISLETREIFAPIAHKLGMWNIKGELEDLAMRYLDPEEYKSLKRKINEKRAEREAKTKEIIEIIKKRLKEVNIDAEVFGRAKYFYSIYKKMKKQGVDFNEIYDLIAIRIITKDVPTCYAALGVVHDLWKPVPKRFKDYIATPKANGYQSLHTTVVGTHGKILEVQIRSEEMHRYAEDGIAAHWKYKGTERDKKFEKRISWLKQLLDWKRDSEDAKDFVETLKIDMFEKEIIVFTPKGDPITLPEGATPIDFAYEVHTSIGDRCSKALVNNRLVQLDAELKSGDIVEIITQKNAKPSRQWLKFVKTNKARQKIRKILNIESDDIKGAQTRPPTSQIEKMLVAEDKRAQLKVSKCCSPSYGDRIAAFYTKDNKITIHKEDCPNVHTLDPNKKVAVEWLKRDARIQRVLRIKVIDRVGILAEILNVLAAYRLNIASLRTQGSKEKNIIDFIKVDIDDMDRYMNAVQEIRKIKDVIDLKEVE
ncbi:MAG: bifunctional (p)ppGpp synthetase/guanosine-3',5'-bis(diphosphate) 3'-pyrophosphohydrolase [Candidatus Woesearchaeota archaeon]